MSRILVVGADAPMRGAMVKILRLSGHEVLESGTSGDDLDAVAHRAEIVVADVVGRAHEAEGVVAAVRARFEGAKVLVIGDPGSVREHAAEGTLAGGFSVGALRAAVNGLLDA